MKLKVKYARPQSSHAIWVSKATHKKARIQALKAEQSMDEFISSLLN